MSRAVVAIMAIVVVGFFAVVGFQAAVDSAGADKEITAESFTPSAGSVTTLDHSNLDHTHYDATVDVRDSNGELMDPENDYVWFQDNGTIKTITGGDLDGETNAEIDYGYETTTTEQRQLARIPAMLPRALGALLPVLGVALLLIITRG